MPDQFDVVVAGAGPVGCVAATLLAQQGVRVLLIEASDSCARDLRASTFHPPTLEMLDEIDVTQALIDHGLAAPVYQYRTRATDEVFELDMHEIADLTRYPFRLQCEQHWLATALTARLASATTAELRFSERLIHLRQDDGGVTVHTETALSVSEYRCQYLIGADGANSLARKWLGVSFSGFTYPEKFLTMSTSWPVEQHFSNLAPVNYIADPDEWLVLLRVPGLWRVLVPADETISDDALLSDATKDTVFGRIVGDDRASDVVTQHRTIYRVHQRVATSFRVGRVFLAGDAAHLNNPLGGFGMNSGIHDAFNLCPKLVTAIRSGRTDNDLFDLYDRQRRTVTEQFVQEQTIRNKQEMEIGSVEAERSRRNFYAALQTDRDNRRAFLKKQSMISSVRAATAIS